MTRARGSSSGRAVERCIRAVLRSGWRHPHFLLLHALVRDRYVEDASVDSLSLAPDGTLRVNPGYIARLDDDSLAGAICHLLLHVALAHAARRSGRSEQVWWKASDMVVNAVLLADGIGLPPDALHPPGHYEGPLQVEPLVEFLERDPAAESDGSGRVTSGCGIPDGWAEAGEHGIPAQALQDAAAQALAIGRASQAGQGTSAVLALFDPVTPKLDWRSLLRHGVNVAQSSSVHDQQTWSRPDRRRETDDGVILPGWLGSECRVAVIVDVSGSMDRLWVAQIVAEIRSLQQARPGTRVWLATHTDKVTWSGWLSPGSLPQATEREAFGWSGGTDPEPAYEEARREGRFDVVVHFTDGQFPERAWPRLPDRARLIVGAFGPDGRAGALGAVPAGALVIPCTHPETAHGPSRPFRS